jgi:hypothetical protein
VKAETLPFKNVFFSKSPPLTFAVYRNILHGSLNFKNVIIVLLPLSALDNA